jgi:hypothetical protein
MPRLCLPDVFDVYQLLSSSSDYSWWSNKFNQTCMRGWNFAIIRHGHYRDRNSTNFVFFDRSIETCRYHCSRIIDMFCCSIFHKEDKLKKLPLNFWLNFTHWENWCHLVTGTSKHTVQMICLQSCLICLLHSAHRGDYWGAGRIKQKWSKLDICANINNTEY